MLMSICQVDLTGVVFAVQTSMLRSCELGSSGFDGVRLGPLPLIRQGCAFLRESTDLLLLTLSPILLGRHQRASVRQPHF